METLIIMDAKKPEGVNNYLEIRQGQIDKEEKSQDYSQFQLRGSVGDNWVQTFNPDGSLDKKQYANTPLALWHSPDEINYMAACKVAAILSVREGREVVDLTNLGKTDSFTLENILKLEKRTQGKSSD